MVSKYKERHNKAKLLDTISPLTSEIVSKQLRSFSVENIEEIKSRHAEDLVFSFVLFDRTHKAFNLGNVCIPWYISLIDTFKELSKMNWCSIQQAGHYDAHEHNWDKTNYTFMFDKKTLDQYEGVQFSLGSTKGRVHGFIVGNVFYVYWLDPYHNLYTVDGRGKENLYSPGLSCMESLNSQIIDLVRENKRLEKESEEFLEDLCKKEEEIKKLKAK